MNWTSIALLVGAAILIAMIALFLTTPTKYPEVDLAEIDRDQLFAQGERLLQAAESWPTDLSAPSVALATSLEPFAVRTVRYQVDVDASLEKVIAYVKNMNYCGRTTRESKDKFEETLYDNSAGADHEWIRRSVHISPPPGKNRDAVVVYFEDRPDSKTYRVGFRSVDSIDGKYIPPVEGAGRFMVNPALYKVEEIAPGKVRIRKIEAVDPQGSVGPLLNNYFISLMFFRNYMFDEAKAMRDALNEMSG
jgi:hypothetical protein